MSEITELADLIRHHPALTRPEVEKVLLARLEPLTVYELRAIYYLCRAAGDAIYEPDNVVGLRATRAVEAMTGPLTVKEGFVLWDAVMRLLSVKDIDLVARQSIQGGLEKRG